MSSRVRDAPATIDLFYQLLRSVIISNHQSTPSTVRRDFRSPAKRQPNRLTRRTKAVLTALISIRKMSSAIISRTGLVRTTLRRYQLVSLLVHRLEARIAFLAVVAAVSHDSTTLGVDA